MSKEQIKKDFEELYLVKNREQLVEEYYRQKKYELFLLLIAGIILIIAVSYSEFKKSQLPEGNIIDRNSYAGEMKLQMKEENSSWQEITLQIEEKEYDDKELEALFAKMIEELPSIILQENEQLEAISRDLELIAEHEDYPFLIRWSVSENKYMDKQGKLTEEKRKEEIPIEIRADFFYDDWERTHIFFCILAESEEEDLKEKVTKIINEEEKKTRTDPYFSLPVKVEGKKLSYRIPRENGGLLMGFTVTLTLLVYGKQKDRSIRKKAEERRKGLKREYGIFVTRLVLYLQAGITVRDAFFQMADDYRKRKQKTGVNHYLYEEITYLCIQMKNGTSDKEAVRLLAVRCPLMEYKRLSSLLINHMEKGSRQLLEQLVGEARGVNDEQERWIRKKGEEMGTKLLLPMMLLLGIVMVLLMVPAFFSIGQ